MIMFGEIGGSAEEEAAEFITANVTKPMSAYIAGVTAPAGKKMGHAGAIVSGGKGTAQGKMDALAAAGVKVGLNPTEAGELMAGIVAEAVTRLPSAHVRAERPGPTAPNAQRPGWVGGPHGTSPVGGGSSSSSSFVPVPRATTRLSHKPPAIWWMREASVFVRSWCCWQLS